MELGMICREEKLWVELWKGLELRRKEAFRPLLLSAGFAQADAIRSGSTGREPFCCGHQELLTGSISIFNVICGSWLLVQALSFLTHPDGRVGHSCWGSDCQWRGVEGCGHRAEGTVVCQLGRNPTEEDGVSCLLPHCSC